MEPVTRWRGPHTLSPSHTHQPTVVTALPRAFQYRPISAALLLSIHHPLSASPHTPWQLPPKFNRRQSSRLPHGVATAEGIASTAGEAGAEPSPLPVTAYRRASPTTPHSAPSPLPHHFRPVAKPRFLFSALRVPMPDSALPADSSAAPPHREVTPQEKSKADLHHSVSTANRPALIHHEYQLKTRTKSPPRAHRCDARSLPTHPAPPRRPSPAAGYSGMFPAHKRDHEHMIT